MEFDFGNGKSAKFEFELGPWDAPNRKLILSFPVDGHTEFRWTCPSNGLAVFAGSCLFFHMLYYLLKIDPESGRAWTYFFDKGYITGISSAPGAIEMFVTDADWNNPQVLRVPHGSPQFQPGLPKELYEEI